MATESPERATMHPSAPMPAWNHAADPPSCTPLPGAPRFRQAAIDEDDAVVLVHRGVVLNSSSPVAYAAAAPAVTVNSPKNCMVRTTKCGGLYPAAPRGAVVATGRHGSARCTQRMVVITAISAWCALDADR